MISHLQLQQYLYFFSTCGENNYSLFTFLDRRFSRLFILYLFYLNVLYLFFLYSSIPIKNYIFIHSLFSNKARGEKSMLILIVYSCGELQQLFLCGELVAFRLCRKLMKRLLKYRFYGLALHMQSREPNQEPAGDAQYQCYIYITLYNKKKSL